MLSASDNHGNIDNTTENPDVTGNVTATNVGANVTIEPELTETELNDQLAVQQAELERIAAQQ